MGKDCGKHLIFLGPPGCGKGTQAGMLSDRSGFMHFSTGDILRESIKDQTPLGIKVKAILDHGDLVSDDVMKEIVLEKFKALSGDDKFILDGYPRTLIQGKDLQEITDITGIAIDLAVYFNIPDQAIIDRISARRICSKCGKVYNLKTLPSKREGFCDDCDIPLIQRDDDKPERVKYRLEVYRELTEPLISFYKDKKLLTEIKGNDKIEFIYENLVKLVVLCP
ncbi:nucleoside monophosphate kinase [bacterium]|nr:nucleoside monophosphate kinase [bacterium]